MESLIDQCLDTTVSLVVLLAFGIVVFSIVNLFNRKK